MVNCSSHIASKATRAGARGALGGSVMLADLSAGMDWTNG